MADDIMSALDVGVPQVKASDLNKGVPTNMSTLATKVGDVYLKGEKDLGTLKETLKTEESKTPVLPTVENGGLKSLPKKDMSDDPIKGWVSTIGILGGLSSAFARSHMTAAMNAAAGVLTSMKTEEAEDFKQKMDIWKIENENAFKVLDYQQKVYKSIIDNKHWDIEEKRAETLAQATALKDEATIEHMKNADWDTHVRTVADLSRAQKQGEKLSAELEERGIKLGLWKDWLKENPTAAPEVKAKMAATIMNPAVMAADIRNGAADKKETVKKAKANADIDNVVSLIDKTIAQGKTAQTEVLGVPLAPQGLQGLVGHVAEGVGLGTGVGGAQAPQAAFNENVSMIAEQAATLLRKGRYSASATTKLEKDLASKGAFSSPETSESALTQLKQHLLSMKTAGEAESSSYNSAEDVGEALRSGDITKEEATKILQDDFGYE